MQTQNWDYLFVSGDDAGKVWRPRYVNGQELPNWKDGPTISDAFYHLIKKGWRLVYPSTVRHDDTLIFRRPKE